MNTNNLIGLHNEAIKKLHEINFFNNIDTAHANKLLAEYNRFVDLKFKEAEKEYVNGDDVITDVCQAFNVTYSDLLKKNRSTHVRYARYTVMYILREHGLTHNRIADYLRPAVTHHSSVIHGVFKIQQLLSTPHDAYYDIVNSLINKY